MPGSPPPGHPARRRSSDLPHPSPKSLLERPALARLFWTLEVFWTVENVEPISVDAPGLGRLLARAAALLGLVVFSRYAAVLAPCIAGVRSTSGLTDRLPR